MMNQEMVSSGHEKKILNQAYEGKRILVTGAGGFLGGALIEAFSEIRCDLVCLSRSGQFPVNQGKARRTDKLAIYNSREFWEKILPGADYIFHFAAQTGVPEAEADACLDYESNVKPLLTFLEVCREMKFSPAVVFAGTATQVGIPDTLPVSEDAPSNPVTVYDFHKQMAENELKNAVLEKIVRGVTLRLTNVYGPGKNVSSPERGVLNQMIRRALEGGVMSVYGSGGEIRDYLYIDDAIRAFLVAACTSGVLCGGQFIIGSGKGHSILESFQIIRDSVMNLTGIEASIELTAYPEKKSKIDSRNFIADSRRFEELTGWRARTNLYQGIERSIRWLTKS